MSSDQKVCPYCGETNPGSWLKNNIILDVLRDPETVKRLIIGINIFFFILSLILSLQSISFSMNPLNFLSPDNRALVALGAGGRLPVDRFGAWWSFLSAGYLHGSILHIVFNMLAFSQLFGLCLNFYGISRSFIIYSISGITGFLLSYLTGTPLTIGASACICGLIGALFFYGKSRGGLYGQIVYKQVSGWIISLVVFGLLIPGIDNFGHLGGFLGGILTAFILGYTEKKSEEMWHRLTALFFAGITVAVLLFCAWTGINIFFF